MRRHLPGLLALKPFGDTERVRFVDLVLADRSYARSQLSDIVALYTPFGIAAERHFLGRGRSRRVPMP